MTTTVTRLEVRISSDLQTKLKRAADLQGSTVSSFVTSTMHDAADRVIEQAEVIRLSLADQERFAQALMTPPEATPALKRAFARRRELVGAD